MKTKRREYHTIVIDPPWPGPGAVPAFDGVNGVKNKRVPVHVIPYSTMTGIQVASLGVPALASQRSQLFMWATSRGLGDAYLLLQSWGFKYRGLFVWAKPLGLGRHVRNQCEFLLWGGRRGAPMVKPGEAPPQIQNWPRRGHSEKPREAYDLIRRLSEAPRLDIFARQKHRGFEPWGNEVAEPLGLEA